MEQFFLVNWIDDGAKKIVVFLTVVGAKTYALLSNVVTPTKPADKSYPELKEVLQTHLKLKTPDLHVVVQVLPTEPEEEREHILRHGPAAEISGPV